MHGGDCLKNILWKANNWPLLLSMKNIVKLCRTNNIPIDTPCDIADCIISKGSIFWKKSNGITVSVCGLLPLDKWWLVNRVLINTVNEILKYHYNIYGFAFIFQEHG